MKKLILFLCISISVLACKAQENKTALNKTKVFLLAGQSNMDGRAKASGLSEIDKQRLKKAQKNVTLFYNFNEGKPLDTTKVAKHTAKNLELTTYLVRSCSSELECLRNILITTLF